MKVVRFAELEWNRQVDHGRFAGLRKALGGEKLTAGLWQLPPGKRSWPLHRHLVTEEGLFVLSGHAKVRTIDVRPPSVPATTSTFPQAAPRNWEGEE